MKKRTSIDMVLHEQENSVHVTLRVNAVKKLNWVREDLGAVRVRLPLPDPTTLVNNARFVAAQNLGPRTVKGQLESYIWSREKGIAEQILEIRKAAKKIERELQCIQIARRITCKLTE